jgi:CBS domain-containing protein
MQKARDRMQSGTGTVHLDHDLAEALARMKQVKAPFLPVVDGDQVVGILTDTDLPAQVASPDDPDDLKVRDRMTPRVVFCFEDDGIEHVQGILDHFGLDRILVISRDRHPVGVIGRDDVASDTGREGKATGAAMSAGEMKSRVIESPPRQEHGMLAARSANPKVSKTTATPDTTQRDI